MPFSYGGDITAIERAINAGEFRIGIHVQGFESGGSESLIVPEPCSMLLSTIGMAVVGALKRRRSI